MECDYCGGPGHTWEQHEQARIDVLVWAREDAARRAE